MSAQNDTETTPPDQADQAPAAVSRRDFLRRAGKDAARTGAELAPLVPGARLLLGPTAAPPAAGEPDDAPLTTRWMKALARWKQRQGGPPADEDKP